MCGIVAAASRRGGINIEAIKSAADCLGHRGPDADGAWASPDGTVGLGHRRLSIIDLSPAGAQPMEFDDGRLRVTLNGEIYNYRELREELRGRGAVFRSRSDTEVLLAAYKEWGTACVERVGGMFAFAIHDTRRGVIFAARDRAGEKPLYYHHARERLSLSSELKAMFADPQFPRVLDPEALDWYLAYGYVPSPLCILRGVAKLPPAHALEYSVADDRLRTWRYWSLPDPPDGEAPTAGLAAELETLVEKAVRSQMVADVDVGVLLSGGLDSSLVTAFASRVSEAPLKTFTVSFPGHSGFDETAHARIVASHFGTEHHELTAEAASVELLDKLAGQYDEPIADSSMIPTYLVAKLVREHAKVALGGDGGDELFGGYPHYSWLQWQSSLRRSLPAAARNMVASVAQRLPVGVRGRNHALALADGNDPLSAVNLLFDAGTRRALSPKVQRPGWEAPETARSRRYSSAASPLARGTRADFEGYLPEDILAKVDRASMLTSLEVRAPLLDTSLVEFAFGRLPDDQRATAKERKVLLRAVAAKILPPQLDLRRKQGFSLPLAAWLRGSWGSFVRETLAGSPPGLLEKREIESLIAGQRAGYANTHRLFALTMLELWRSHHRIDVG